MAGAVTWVRLRSAWGPALDWLVLLGVLGLIARMAFGGVTFVPAAGFAQNRLPLLWFEQAVALVGAGALGRWLLAGGRALPGALLGTLAAATALALLSFVTTTDRYATREAVFFLVAIVVAALAVAMSATDGIKARGFLAGLALMGAAEAIIGLGQYASGAATPAYWLSHAFAGAIRTRIHGTFGNPNVLVGDGDLRRKRVEVAVIESRPPGRRRRAVGRLRRLPIGVLLESGRQLHVRTHVIGPDRAAGQKERRHKAGRGAGGGPHCGFAGSTATGSVALPSGAGPRARNAATFERSRSRLKYTTGVV